MIVLSSEVQTAFKNGVPVVALESTLISHGLPYPKNLELAQQIESEIRALGCVPATIAVLRGQIHVGLSAADIEFLATANDIYKVNASDVALCVASGANGATTVAGTMFCAQLAGIRIFATGGMGGVHRGAELSFDVSQDLMAFKNYPVAVITAGAKAILDLPKTLEVLETYGVPIIGFGTKTFPAFWTRSSGLGLTWSVDDAAAAAHMLHVHWQSGQTSGVVVANPIPAAFEIPASVIEQALTTALAESQSQQIGGKAVTPFLLKRLRELVPATMPSNIELILHNARTSANIAAAYINYK